MVKWSHGAQSDAGMDFQHTYFSGSDAQAIGQRNAAYIPIVISRPSPNATAIHVAMSAQSANIALTGQVITDVDVSYDVCPAGIPFSLSSKVGKSSKTHLFFSALWMMVTGLRAVAMMVFPDLHHSLTWRKNVLRRSQIDLGYRFVNAAGAHGYPVASAVGRSEDDGPAGAWPIPVTRPVSRC